MKNLIRSESPRDYVDLERSLKHRPTLFICDVAHLVAKMANREFPGFFEPNSGRLGPANAELVKKAIDGDIMFDLPFLDEAQPTDQVEADGHPVTGVSQHLALFDWLHQHNCKDQLETLRRPSLLKQTAGLVNTQTAESTFAESRKDIYFLNMMSPVKHLAIFRLIHHLRNEDINRMLTAKMTKLIGVNLVMNSFGQLIQANRAIMECQQPAKEAMVVDIIDEWAGCCSAQDDKIGNDLPHNRTARGPTNNI